MRKWFWQKEPKSISPVDEIMDLYGPSEWSVIAEIGDLTIEVSKCGKFFRTNRDVWRYTHYFGELDSENVEASIQKHQPKNYNYTP